MDKIEIKRRKSFSGLIYDSKKNYGDNLAYIYKPTYKYEQDNFDKYVKKTHNDMYFDILKLQKFLKENNIDKTRIAVLGRNSYTWFVLFASIVTTENICVPLDKELQLNELENSLDRSEAKFIFYDDKFADTVLEAAKNQNVKTFSFNYMKDYLYTTEIDKEQAELEDIKYVEEQEKRFEEYEKKYGYNAIKDTPKNFEKDVLSEEDIKIILFTSGTTSMSKLVLITRENILFNIYSTFFHEPFLAKDTELALIPMHHIFGLGSSIVMRIAGIVTAYPDGLRYIQQNLSEYGVTLFVGVPLLNKAIYEKIKTKAKKSKKWVLLKIMIGFSNFLRKVFKIDIRRKLFKSIIDPLGGKLNIIITAAAPIDPETWKFFNNIGITMIQGYGLTETSPVICAEQPHTQRIGSVGIPMDGIDVRIDKNELIKYYEEQLDLTKKDNIKFLESIKKGNEGEIVINAPSVTRGYYKDLERTKSAFIGDTRWFKTGDIGRIEKGFIYITGRIKDMIVLPNGKKAFPEELEFLINSIDGVSDSFVFGTAEDIGFGSNGEIRIYTKIKYDPEHFKGKTEEEIHNILWEGVKEKNKTLPKYKYIKGLLITTDEFTQTSTRKIKRPIEKAKILENAKKNND